MTLLTITIHQEGQPVQWLSAKADGTFYVVRLSGFPDAYSPPGINVALAAQAYEDPAPIDPNARGIQGVWYRSTVSIKPTWNTCIIPSNRPLWKILADVRTHLEDFPGHGSDCACLDEYIREVRNHLYRVIPGRESEDWRIRSAFSYVLAAGSRTY